METQQKAAKRDLRYRVISVEKAKAPEGMTGKNWHRYVVGQGTSRIEGLRTGTLKAVTEHVENWVQELNERGVRGYSSFSPRNQKK
jgi:hypothetical protein